MEKAGRVIAAFIPMVLKSARIPLKSVLVRVLGAGVGAWGTESGTDRQRWSTTGGWAAARLMAETMAFNDALVIDESTPTPHRT